MLKLRLKNSSQSYEFDTKNFGVKGNLISVYDPELTKSFKFFINNIFDIKLSNLEINDDLKFLICKKKFNIKLLLKDTSAPFSFSNVVQTDTNDKFFIIHAIGQGGELEIRYIPSNDIVYIEEEY